MGASEFGTTVIADTADEAFRLAKDEACYQFGHAGYTGTIAEKNEFTVVDLPKDMEISTAIELMDEYHMRECEERSCASGTVRELRRDHIPLPEEHHPLLKKMSGIFNNKWGPALCIKTEVDGKTAWLFCGLASS